MKNEQLLKAIENASASFVEAVKAMTQLSNAVLSLNKKHDVKEKTAPLPNPKPNEIKEWNEAMIIWKKIMMKKFPDEFQNTTPSSQITDALAGMHEENPEGLYKKFHEPYNVPIDPKIKVEYSFPTSASYMAACIKDLEKHSPSLKNGKMMLDDKSIMGLNSYPDYVCVKDVDIYDDIKCGNVFKFFEGIGYKNICYPSDTIILPEFFTVDHKDHFKVYDPKKEVEAEKLNKQCEELIEKFMPLVSKWKFEGNTIINEAEHYNGVWSYSDNNKRKAAIRCAILHCELCNHDSSAKLILQLQKMLSE